MGAKGSSPAPTPTCHRPFHCVWCACQVPSVMSNSATLWTVACQALLSVGFSRHEQSGATISFSRGSSQPRDQTRASSAPTLQADSSPQAPLGSAFHWTRTEPTGKHFTRHLDPTKVGQGLWKIHLEGNVLEEIGDPLPLLLPGKGNVALGPKSSRRPGSRERKQGTGAGVWFSPPAREGAPPEGLPWTSMLLLDGICCGQ